MRVKRPTRVNTMQFSLCILFTGVGLLMHGGTALLRLNLLLPVPRAMDFAAFYAGAYMFATGQSPYVWSPADAEILQRWIGLGFAPPVSTPGWLLVMAPLVAFSFPLASAIWLLLLVMLVAWSASRLTEFAGYRSLAVKFIVFLLVITFGPTFLTLSLGQNSILLLVAVLLAADYLRTSQARYFVLTSFSWALAILAKLFPVLWFGILLLLGRIRLLVVIAAFVLLISGIAQWVAPVAGADYWTSFFGAQMTQYSDEGGIDDQSLVSWFLRIGRPQTYNLSGISVENQHRIEWDPPWNLSSATLILGAYVVLAVVTVLVVYVIWRQRGGDPEGMLFLWVLLTTLLVPHMVRYNHVLLLPAMAWLWQKGKAARVAVCLAYALTGADRLTHLWALLAPAPLAAFASGFGIVATFMLLGASVKTMWPVNTQQLLTKQ